MFYSLLLASCCCGVFPDSFTNTFDSTTVRKLSVRNIDKQNKEKYLKATSFVLNSISKRRRVVKPKLDGEYIKFDLEDYGINPKIYDNIKSPYKEMRADWFIINAMRAPLYYRLLGLSNLRSFYKLTNYEKRHRHLEQRAVVEDSAVARNNRLFVRKPTVTGFVWESHDVPNEIGENDYMRHLLDDCEGDSHSLLASAPNGMLVYFMADRRGNSLNSGDANVMLDPNGEDKIVRMAGSCVKCHSAGIQPIKDVVRMLGGSDRGLRLASADKKSSNRIMEMYGSKLPIKADQETYADALKAVNGLTPQENARQFNDICVKYGAPMSAEDCAKELGIARKQFGRICETSYLVELQMMRYRNKAMRRDRWERIYDCFDK